MLYDPKWEVVPLNLESLIAWLEKMPASDPYNYEDCKGGCLYGLYMASHGVAWWESGACSEIDSGKKRVDFCAFVYAHIAASRPHTFGAALGRAYKARLRNHRNGI